MAAQCGREWTSFLMRGTCSQWLHWRRSAGVALALCLASAVSLQAGAAQPGEYQVKATYLYNFITFTEWPATTGDTLRLCVYGADPFGAQLAALEGRKVGGRALSVARSVSADDLAACQVVFVSAEASGDLPRVLDQLRGQPVLTLADSPGAARAGVGINMRSDGDRVVFDVNLAAVREQGLNLSFRLLRLAAEVIK